MIATSLYQALTYGMLRAMDKITCFMATYLETYGYAPSAWILVKMRLSRVRLKSRMMAHQHATIIGSGNKGLTAEIECEARDGGQIDRLVENLRAKGYVVELAELA